MIIPIGQRAHQSERSRNWENNWEGLRLEKFCSIFCGYPEKSLVWHYYTYKYTFLDFLYLL